MNNRFSFSSALFKSAAILTLAGIATKLLGFYYRIFLTSCVGAAGVGLFQMSMPLAAFAFAVCCNGFSLAVSKFSAGSPSLKWLFGGMGISLVLSCMAAFVFTVNSDFIASRILLDIRCQGLIKIIALSLPFMAMHNCISSYFYGQNESLIPALSQLIEQVVRIAGVMIYIHFTRIEDITVDDAVIGNVLGEIAASVWCFIPIIFRSRKNSRMLDDVLCSPGDLRKLAAYALPVNASQTIMHLLESAEAILIPALLTVSGITRNDALCRFGILTGMALPLVMFPCTAANSFAVMLLPRVSYDNCKNNDKILCRTVQATVRMCLNLGIISIFLFVNYGAGLGAFIFGEANVYSYTCVLAWLCPFMYLKISLGSILNGMGRTGFSCLSNIVGIIIRLALTITLILRIGICGYLYGLLAGSIVVSLLYIAKLYLMLEITPNPFCMIIIPLCMSVIAVFTSKILCRIVFGSILKNTGEPAMLFTGALICCLVYLFLFIRDMRT